MTNHALYSSPTQALKHVFTSRLGISHLTIQRLTDIFQRSLEICLIMSVNFKAFRSGHWSCFYLD